MHEWYTQEEVAKLLGIPKTTVYHYAKQGKIKKIPDPHRNYRYPRYEKEKVDQLAAQRKHQPQGMKPSEVARELGITVQSVLRQIREGHIVAEKAQMGEEGYHYVISEEEFERAKKKLQKTPPHVLIRKNEYFEIGKGIALFQLFRSPQQQEARVTKHGDDWGFFLLKERKWIPYDEGKTYFQPVYSIHQPILEPKGYVYFEIPFGEAVLYPFIDYLYEVWGVANIRIRDQDLSILISVKVDQRPFRGEAFSLADILPFVKEGKVHVKNGLFILESIYRKTTIELPHNILEKVRQLSEQEQMTMSQWVEKAIKQALAKNQHDKL